MCGEISWHVGPFDSPAARNAGRLPEIRVLSGQITDDLGNKCDLDRYHCRYAKHDWHAGFQLEMHVAGQKVTPQARELHLDMVVSIDGQKFRLEDTMLKVNGKKWQSEWIVRATEEARRLRELEKQAPPGQR